MRFLVTGATGFLGWRSAELLAERGHEVLARGEAGPRRSRPFRRRSTRSSLDAGDPAARELIAGCDAVLHFAGVPDPAHARDDPARAVRENAGTTVNLLEGCLEHGAGLIYPSTVRAAYRPSTGRVCAVQVAGRAGLPASPGAGHGRQADLGLRPGPGRMGGRDRRDRGLRRARARRRPDRDPRRPARGRATSSTSTMSCRRSRAIARDGRWDETFTLAQRRRRPRFCDAAELVREAAGSSSEIETPEESCSRGRESTATRPIRGAGARLPRPPARGGHRARMSTGSAAIPLLKAAPEPEQIADRLGGGPGAGSSSAWGRHTCATTRRLGRAVDVVRSAGSSRCDLAVTAEAPVSWPSGAFVRVDRLDDEARAGIERSAEFAAAIGSPVLTIHLFTPLDPEEFRAAGAGRRGGGRAVPRLLRRGLRSSRGVKPLIENVPPVLRMRTGGVYLSPIGGHWRDLARLARARARARLHDRHLARRPLPLLRRRLSRAASGSSSDEELELERYVEELGPAARGRARLGRPRPARRGPPLRRRRARPRPDRPAPRRAGPLHRGRDQRARPRRARPT